jgi:hypothetical protein
VSINAGNPGLRFPTTHWSEVARAGDADPQIKREALGRLLAAYTPALRAHLLARKRVLPDRADDLLQGFICDQVVADDLMSRAKEERGRLRSFVVVALDRYVVRVLRAENAQKRRPDGLLVPIEDGLLTREGQMTATDTFDLAWAREVVQRAIRQMRDQCRTGGREQTWLVFETCALAPLFDGSEPPSHAVTMQRLGFDSPQQVSNALVTAKRTFARCLRAIVGEYGRDEDEIEAELRDLWSILSHGSTIK